MTDENDWLRLARYFAGESTADERRDVERWIAADPERGDVVARLRAAWDRAGGPEAPVDVEGAWGEVVRRKAARAVPEPVLGRRAARERRRVFAQIPGNGGRRWRAVAAAASIAVAVTSVALWRAQHPAPSSVADAGPMRVVTTARGQTAEVYLADGTHVRLGAASTLRFPTTFGATRPVYLEGEGYFDVVHDSRREFAVHTAGAVARDVGTRFNVRAYAAGSGTEVLVTEGAVALKPAAPAGRPSPTDSVVLTRSDLGRVDAEGSVRVTRGVDGDAYLAWTRGRLVFADTPLREALPQLSRWYGVDVTVGDSALADARLTAELELGSLPDALSRLSTLLDARAERRGQTVVLHPKRHAR